MARADFDRLIAKLASAHSKQEARDILQAAKPVLDWIDDLPAREASIRMEQIQDVIAELLEHD
jgi:hypothetical protein